MNFADYKTLISSSLCSIWVRLVVLGGIAGVLYTTAQLSLPWFVALIIDSAAKRSETNLLLPRAALMAAVALGSVVSQSVLLICFTSLSQRSLLNLRKRMTSHLEGLPVAVFESQHSGKLKSLFTEDGPMFVRIYHPILSDLLLSLVQFAGIIAILCVKFSSSALLAFILIPIYLLLPLLTSRATRSASLELAESKANLAMTLQEVIQAAKEIKVLTQDTWRRCRVGDCAEQAWKKQIKVQALSMVSSLNYAAYWATLGFLYWVGGNLAFAGKITIGELVLFVWYLSLLDVPAGRLVSAYTQLQACFGPAKRIASFLKLSPEESDFGAGKTLTRSPRAVEFRNVSFRYSPISPYALRDVSFKIPTGSHVAIVGPSGAGKSTLVSMLLRFYEPESGRILLADEDLRAYDLSSLRRSIGIVLQETFLFAGTISDNIGLALPKCAKSDIESAARIANAHEFINALPQGYETYIGERGVKLSVGQRQRISIARTILRDPSILILDEATSSLDAESESEVVQALERLMTGRTVLAVSHRYSMMMTADLILVIESGQLVGGGAHETLMRTCPTYHKLLFRREPQSGDTRTLLSVKEQGSGVLLGN